MMNLGILGCSEIAFRRFMPAAESLNIINICSIAEEYDKSKLTDFCDKYKLEIKEDFKTLISDKSLNAVYIPQPPALHYKWAKLALEHGLHVLIEKPSTISYEQSKELVDIARKNNLALHENYMFQYHSQIDKIRDIINSGKVGEIRLLRADFGFPKRAANDFRYNKSLGGGALLDAGGYAVKLASILLGDTIKVDSAMLNYLPEYEVDMYGSASLSNSSGQVMQIGFGMDNSYRCSLDIWGSTGHLFTNRIFTAPENYNPIINIEYADRKEEITLEPDTHFSHSIEMFIVETRDNFAREQMYDNILLQAKLIDDISSKGQKQ